jgi:hypothetical protein
MAKRGRGIASCLVFKFVEPFGRPRQTLNGGAARNLVLAGE